MRANEHGWSPADPVEVDLLLDADGTLRYASASRTSAERVGLAKEVYAEGPCHEAFAGEEVTSADVQARPRWQRLSTRLAIRPARTVIGVPILLDGRSIGVEPRPHRRTTA